MAMTKAEMAKRLAEAESELTAMREFLAAIAVLADVPAPADRQHWRWPAVVSDRLSLIKIYATNDDRPVSAGAWCAWSETLRQRAAMPLGYEVFQGEPC